MEIQLYKSLYPYNGEFQGSLQFKANEIFLVLRKENEYWFLVSSKDGTLGCVPINYLQKLQMAENEENTNLLSQIIKTAIESLSQKSASIINKRDYLIKSLTEYTNSSIKNGDTNKNISEKIKENVGQNRPSEPSRVPNGLAYKLTDVIRQTTNSSHNSSLFALQNLLNILDSHIPEMRLWTNSIQSQIKDPSKYNLPEAFQSSIDWINLEDLFKYFHQRKNDSQERGWSLHENVSELRQKLFKLLKILKMSNNQLVSSYLANSKYEHLLSMLEWYQLEQRTPIRRILLQIFIVCCEINKKAADVCLQSVVPLELIRDIMDVHTDNHNFTYATLLLTILINDSKSINLEVKEKLDEKFCEYLLTKLSKHQVLNASGGSTRNNCTEDDDFSDDDMQHPDDSDDQRRRNSTCQSPLSSEHGSPMFSLKPRLYMDDVVFACLLTLNKLCQRSVSSNPVIQSLLKDTEASQVFVEKLITAFNRNIDPSLTNEYLNDNQPDACSQSPTRTRENNSVRKFLCDVYSSKEVSEMVYSHDANLIVDVIARQIFDIAPDSKELSEYLVLLDLIVTNSDYGARGSYKMYDIQQALTALLQSLDDDDDHQNSGFLRSLALSISQKLDSVV